LHPFDFIGGSVSAQEPTAEEIQEEQAKLPKQTAKVLVKIILWEPSEEIEQTHVIDFYDPRALITIHSQVRDNVMKRELWKILDENGVEKEWISPLRITGVRIKVLEINGHALDADIAVPDPAHIKDLTNQHVRPEDLVDPLKQPQGKRGGIHIATH
jgi:hypothetical protein